MEGSILVAPRNVSKLFNKQLMPTFLPSACGQEEIPLRWFEHRTACNPSPWSGQSEGQEEIRNNAPEPNSQASVELLLLVVTNWSSIW